MLMSLKNRHNMRKLFLLLCVIACLIPIYGQNDTITADGLCLKYDSPTYNGSGISRMTSEKLKNKDFYVGLPNDSDRVRGELDRVTKRTGLTYKAPTQYIVSETFGLNFPPANPIELHRTANNVIASKWIHEDGECILFIKCHGMKAKIDKSIDELPESKINWIKNALGIGSIFSETTEEQMKEIKKIITIWSPQKSKKTFNAQYVITYPIVNEKSVYMDKYAHKLELIMIKWGEDLSVSFLLTQKGYKNINKYMKDVEGAFLFED